MGRADLRFEITNQTAEDQIIITRRKRSYFEGNSLIACFWLSQLTCGSAETNSAIFDYLIVTVPFKCISMYTNYLGKYVIGLHVMFTCFEMASSSKSCVKSRLLRSPVWDYFEISGDKKVCCKLCVPPAATTLAYDGGTTSMQSHLWSHLYNYCSLLLY